MFKIWLIFGNQFYLLWLKASFMNNMKGFILGFGLSILGVSLYSNSSSSLQTQNNYKKSNIKIELFKEANALTNKDINILSSIQKETIFEADFKALDIPNTTTAQTNNTNKDELDIAYNLSDINTSNEDTSNLNYEDINGIEDEEILIISSDDTIPMEINDFGTQNASLNTTANNDKVAMLPTDLTETNDFFEDNTSPWVVAKGKKSDGTMFISDEDNFQISKTFNTEDVAQEDLSYEVAKRIKQNIIFPIPDEILNDENLTPTFVKQNNETSTKKEEEKPLKIIEKKKVEPAKEAKTENKIVNSISSWFNGDDNKKTQESKPKKTKATPPVYTSQSETSSNAPQKQNIGDFYEALQKTKSNYNKNNITPTELKLSFNNNRAEISGQTLRWLKAFSEKTLDGNYYLQVKLDASTPTELQRKRLNLLYTIFINNGVDVNKVDTKFSNIEPNTFIIRTQKLTKPHN